MKYILSRPLLIVKRCVIKKSGMLLMLLLSCFAFISCSKDLDIQTNFPFELEIMPIPSTVPADQVVEIPCHIKKTGNYTETKYTIRYFQYEGVGSLKFPGDKPFIPNKLYKIPKDTFMLNYRPKTKEKHSFKIWVADQFGNEKNAEFDFN
ncbi:TraQ conjugal transfer family protein [Chitinophaga sp. 22321]|uniref:DUF3872 domain-containing protein n=1 Tax=Chitinophaga hostae TaxID=2831022 RepID=A0ABS5IWL9_9BACT|nr:TraQ conjugal transfer family protein [Chitinophaga hostae]MBS0027238.1 DUF3872 domain-containing protein [Chitinophaga hostae]